MMMNSLAMSTLRHIQIATEARDRAAPFRTFFDNHFAYRSGGPFLSRTGTPLWFNAPCPKRDREALMGAHFVSAEAMRVIAGLSSEALVRDHAIPVRVLRDLLMNAHAPTIQLINGYMQDFYRLGIITRSEDQRLNAAGLRSTMPEGWTGRCSPFARYDVVGITAQQLRAGR